MPMDALDEFFVTWSEPEAWCGICATRPAIHVVLRDTGGIYGGITSHVRIWDPAMQMHVAVCRQCCQQRMAYLGRLQPARPPLQPHLRPLPNASQLPLQHWVQRLLGHALTLLRQCTSRWWR
jgi:hypothetical protein